MATATEPHQDQENVAVKGFDQRFVATFDARGRLEMVHVPTDMPLQVRKRLVTAVANIQVTAPVGANTLQWLVEEHDTTGDYDAQYKRTTDLELTKTKTSYLRVHRKRRRRHAVQPRGVPGR